MEYFKLFVYLLLFSSGIAGTAFCFYLWRTTKENDLLLHFVLHFIYTLSLVISIAVVFVMLLLREPPVFFPEAVGIGGNLLGVVVYLLLFVFFRNLFSQRFSLPYQLLLLFGVIFYSIQFAGYALQAVGFEILFSRFLQRIIFWYSSAAVAGIGYFLFLSYRGNSTAASKIFYPLGILMIGFFPAAVIDYVLTRGGVGSPVSMNFLFYLLWNCIIISAFFRVFGDRQGKAAASENDLESIMAEKGLSKREKEVARLLVAGKTNKEIADHLNVGMTTARTHVYNIYKKVQVQSRVELVRLLTGIENQKT
ncbi:MAG: helix-turn-helix domain-containing protein [Spirochaetia bacterium]